MFYTTQYVPVQSDSTCSFRHGLQGELFFFLLLRILISEWVSIRRELRDAFQVCVCVCVPRRLTSSHRGTRIPSLVSCQHAEPNCTKRVEQRNTRDLLQENRGSCVFAAVFFNCSGPKYVLSPDVTILKSQIVQRAAACHSDPASLGKGTVWKNSYFVLLCVLRGLLWQATKWEL